VTAFWGAVCAPPRDTVKFVGSDADSDTDAVRVATTRRSLGASPTTALPCSSRTQVGADLEHMSPEFMAKFHKDDAHTRVSVPCQPMGTYLEGLTHVDFFSLDVEGAEFRILETIDFTVLTVDVFVIEMMYYDLEHNWLIREFLRNIGYVECTGVVERSGLFVRKAALDDLKLTRPCEPYTDIQFMPAIDKSWNNRQAVEAIRKKYGLPAPEPRR